MKTEGEGEEEGHDKVIGETSEVEERKNNRKENAKRKET